jgi:predicted nuclease with RNAse H fold
VITVGVDLAAEPRKTAACCIDWATGGTELFPSGVTDSLIVELAGPATVVGLDVPLGWPQEFVRVIAAHEAGAPWAAAPAGTIAGRERLRFRTTDLHLRRRGHRPLSVSTELIGVVALRGAHLQHLMTLAGMTVDRSGVSGRVVEVYPAAALRAWGLPSSGYKGLPNTAARLELVERLLAECGDLRPAVDVQVLGASDHALDAFLCAVISAAARSGLTEPPGEADVLAARMEGWIHLPTAGLAAILRSAREAAVG